jgi:hypothetical protein
MATLRLNYLNATADKHTDSVGTFYCLNWTPPLSRLSKRKREPEQSGSLAFFLRPPAAHKLRCRRPIWRTTSSLLRLWGESGAPNAAGGTLSTMRPATATTAADIESQAACSTFCCSQLKACLAQRQCDLRTITAITCQ